MIKFLMVLSSLLTLLSYVLSIIVLKEYFDIRYVDSEFAFKVLIVTLVSWLPIHVIACIMRKIFPTEQQKILKQEQYAMKRDLK